GLSIETGPAAALHRAARERGVPVAGEIELFAQALATLREQDYRPRLIAVTGTNGKTTTTALVAHLCEQAGLSARAAGNIGPAALDALREAVDADALPEVWVLELSSFQLALTDSLRPDAAAILNLTQDHLDWHASMASYAAAKQRIYAPGTVVVCNRQDAATRPARQRPVGGIVSIGLDAPAVAGDLGVISERGVDWLAEAVPAEEVVSRRNKQPVPVLVKRMMPAEALRLRGRHNQANVLAALALCRAIGIKLGRLLHGLRDFAGEPHRCQLVATIDGVEYYDDSKGTNVGATVAALAGLGRRAVLIAGGDGKGQDFAPLAAAVARHARAVVRIGRDGPRIGEALAARCVAPHAADDLPGAVRLAATLARDGDAVLLSPACASFDMFRNYAHRAEVFVDTVRELAADAGVPC
ncbi:MAG: UDP-N-acetylmuramoyl-L-alanine--D-glutamate ligase, partial [Burkholderiaceae bacterium]